MMDCLIRHVQFPLFVFHLVFIIGKVNGKSFPFSSDVCRNNFDNDNDSSEFPEKTANNLIQKSLDNTDFLQSRGISFKLRRDFSHFIKLSDSSPSKGHSSLLTNTDNLLYFIQLDVGTPSQSQKVFINLGKKDSWLISKNCGSNCTETYNAFNPSSSKTYENLGISKTIEFSKSINIKLNGTLSQDSLSIFDSKNNNNFPFILINWMEKPITRLLDGSLGLGVDSQLTTKNNTFISFLKNNKLINESIFSLGLSSIEADSEITFGGVNRDIVKNSSLLKFCSVVKSKVPSNLQAEIQEAWSCRSTSLSFSNSTHNFTINHERVITFDSLTNLLVIPKKDFLLLKKYILRDENDCQYFGDSLFHCTCSANDFTTNFAFPEFKIQLESSEKGKNGAELKLDSHDYIFMDSLNQIRDTNCILGIRVRFDDSDEWIIGNSILRNYYTIFNYDAQNIGFYEVKPPLYNSYTMILIISLCVIISGLFLFSVLYYIYKKCVRNNRENERLV